jgi:hypothetical protein
VKTLHFCWQGPGRLVLWCEGCLGLHGGCVEDYFTCRTKKLFFPCQRFGESLRDMFLVGLSSDDLSHLEY